MSNARRILLTLALVLWLPCAALAQAPKLGGEKYTDANDLGFSLRTPAGWQFIPPSPDERNLVGKYDGPDGQGMTMRGGGYIGHSMWIVKFDRRTLAQGKKAPPKDRAVREELKELAPWVEQTIVGTGWTKDSEDKKTINKIPATEVQFQGTFSTGGHKDPLRVYALIYHLSPEVDVAVVFNGPGDGAKDPKWKKFEKPFRQVAETMQRIAVEQTAVASGSGARDIKRSELQLEVQRSPDWELYETPNYFVISNNPDKAFIKELCERLEAIRKEYERDYPAALAAELKALAKDKKPVEPAAPGNPATPATPGTPATPAAPPPAKEGQESELETSAGRFTVEELSKTSVVRVCANSDQYHSYGGPGGSAGYWSPNDRELVVYDDKASGGRRDTWATLNHEAFHQYIFYFFGALSPHSWYNEGTGDYYAGAQYKNGRFEIKPFDWRQGLIRENIKAGKFAPLKELVRWDQAQYYGNNKLGLGGGDNYAQGWSFIYFLRTGQKTRGFDPAWGSILDTYLRALVETDDLEAAVDRAFAGVDWNKLEECWKAYTL